MNFLKTKTGKALLGVLVALGVLAGTILNDVETPVGVGVEQVAN